MSKSGAERRVQIPLTVHCYGMVQLVQVSVGDDIYKCSDRDTIIKLSRWMYD